MHLSIMPIVSLAFNIICIKYSDAAVGKAFSLVIPDGNDGRSCAIEAPSTEEFRSDVIQCGASCTTEPSCIYFSYTEETQRCLSFDSLPTTFATVDSCNTYRVLIPEVSPQDVQAFTGSRTTLECRRSSPVVEWTFAEVSNATSKVIVERCEVGDEYTDLYAVDRSDLSCNLIINNIKMEHGGLYTCRDQLSTEASSTAKVDVCPAGFESLNGSNTYYQMIYKPVNWTAAGQLCNALVSGSYSVMITSPEENSAVAAYLTQRSADNASDICMFDKANSKSKEIWTSGQRLTPNCNSPFAWKPNVNTSINFSYLNWGLNQPDCGTGNTYCIFLWQSQGYRWNDIDCSTKFCVLCEYGPF